MLLMVVVMDDGDGEDVELYRMVVMAVVVVM